MDLRIAHKLSPPDKTENICESTRANKLPPPQTENFHDLLVSTLVKTSSFDKTITDRSFSASHPSLLEQMRIYKEDQLLSHPGGDYVELKGRSLRARPEKNYNFWERVGKDFRDALENARNFFHDIILGSKYRYLDNKDQPHDTRRKGLLKNMFGFFKDVISGLSFGYYRSPDEVEPKGIFERAQFLERKLINKAIFNNMIFGIPSSIINLLDDATLSLWNLMEVVPDATIGNISQGEKIVTTLFDNGQVIVDYITDCMPTGDAWMRVHAYQFNNRKIIPPILFNLKLPERYSQDSRWATVRNTPLRKAIETIGSLLADLGIAMSVHYAIHTSKKRD